MGDGSISKRGAKKAADLAAVSDAEAIRNAVRTLLSSRFLDFAECTLTYRWRTWVDNDYRFLR